MAHFFAGVFVLIGSLIEYHLHMLERVIRKEFFPIIKNYFIILEESYGVTIPDTEIAYIVDLFTLNFPQIK